MLTFLTMTATAQQPDAPGKAIAAPYDSIATDGETYAGPARQSTWDESGSTIYIGLLAPLKGSQSAEGEALVVAAKMALADSTQHPLPSGQRIELAIGDESGPAWGHVSDVILHLVLQQNVVALITSTDGTETHISEQVANRVGVPVLTLSSDATTTQIDIPWIFRLGPSDVQQALSMAQDIYGERGTKKTMVIFAQDHDGKGGVAAMRQAVIASGASTPAEAVVDPLHPDFSAVVRQIQADSPQAIVLWTQAEDARSLLSRVRGAGISTPVYFSQQAAQMGAEMPLFPPTTKEAGNAWNVIDGGANTAARRSFATRYLQRTGRHPSAAAAEAYDAVCLTVDSLRKAGPNRARVRDRLAKTQDFSGVSGTITFDRQGNNTSQIHLVALWLQQLSTKIGGGAE